MSVNANDLILFAHIMEMGSFSKAADHLDLPKSTLSRRISELEASLGERLITRSTRQLVITDFGQGILDYARRLQEETEAAASFALHRQATPQGKLRVSLPPEFKEFDLVNFTQAFLKKYPDLILELDLSSRRVDVLAERFDIAVRVASHLPDDAMLVARKVATLDNGLYASPLYLKAHGVPKQPSDLLASHGVLLTNSQGEQRVWRLSRGSEVWEGMPKHSLSSNSVSFNLNMALEGTGIIAASGFFACQYVRQGSLVRVLPEWFLPSDSIWCVTPGRRLLSMGTRVFIERFGAMLNQSSDVEPHKK